MKVSQRLDSIRNRRTRKENIHIKSPLNFNKIDLTLIGRCIAANPDLEIRYPIKNHNNYNLAKLKDFGIKKIKLILPEDNKIKQHLEQITEITSYCKSLGLGVSFNKYSRGLGAVMDSLFAGPERVGMILTKECNYHCSFCNGGSSGTMRKEVALKTLGGAKELGTKEILLLGGEPLLYPDLLDILSYIKEEGMSATLFTNASLLSRNLCKKLVELNLSSIHVNLSAVDEETYSIHHCTEKSKMTFSKIIEKLKFLHQLKLECNCVSPHLNLVFVMTKHLFGRFKEIADISRSVGANSITIKPLQVTNQGTLSLLPSKTQIDDFKRNYETYQHHLSELGSLQPLRTAISPPSESGAYYKNSYEKMPCLVAWTYSQVDPYGLVSPCCLFGSYKLGDLNHQTLPEIWSGEEYWNFRKKTRDLAFMRHKKECHLCPNYLWDVAPMHERIKLLGLDKELYFRDSDIS